MDNTQNYEIGKTYEFPFWGKMKYLGHPPEGTNWDEWLPEVPVIRTEVRGKDLVVAFNRAQGGNKRNG